MVCDRGRLGRGGAWWALAIAILLAGLPLAAAYPAWAAETSPYLAGASETIAYPEGAAETGEDEAAGALVEIKSGSAVVRVAEVDVHYDWAAPLDGEASSPAIVLLHGLGGSGESWLKNAAPLAQAGFTVYAPDLPGFGNSGEPAEEISVLEYPFYVAGFLDGVGEERVILVGHSMGGYISWLFAANYPERTVALVLVDAAGLPLPEELTPGLARIAPFMTAYRKLTWLHPGVQWFVDRSENEALTRKMAKPMIEMGFADPRRITEDIWESSYESLRNSRIIMYGKLEFVVPAPNYEACLRLNTRPTLIIWGREDQVIPVDDGQRFTDLIPDSRLVVLDGVGHVPMQEVPDEFNRLVLDFVRSLPF